MTSSPPDDPAALFAALGDQVRLSLIDQLQRGGGASIAELSAGRPLSRQAVTKHLRLLEKAGLVRPARSGREVRFRLEAARLAEAQRFLDRIARQWEESLARLAAHAGD